MAGRKGASLAERGEHYRCGGFSAQGRRFAAKRRPGKGARRAVAAARNGMDRVRIPNGQTGAARSHTPALKAAMPRLNVEDAFLDALDHVGTNIRLAMFALEPFDRLADDFGL